MISILLSTGLESKGIGTTASLRETVAPNLWDRRYNTTEAIASCLKDWICGPKETGELVYCITHKYKSYHLKSIALEPLRPCSALIIGRTSYRVLQVGCQIEAVVTTQRESVWFYKIDLISLHLLHLQFDNQPAVAVGPEEHHL